VGLAKEFDASKLITLGAFLADVPHTRDVPVVGSAGNPEEAEDLGLAGSTYEGPTGIVGVIHDLAIRSGLPSVSFWAAVPHYVPSSENPKAALALARRFCSFSHLPLDLSELEPQAQAWEDSVSEQVRENEALTDYIQGLEETGPELELDLDAGGGGLADEIERFLEQRGGEG
jgi:proteasome assembly chaperone (PAC2) family protein